MHGGRISIDWLVVVRDFWLLQFSDRDSIFQYVEDYFDKYVGRGLPVTVDPVLISTIRQSTGGGAGASKEDHKTLKNRGNDLESVLTKL